MKGKTDMIYDLLKTDRQEAAQFRKEVIDANAQIVERLSKIEALDEEQNKHLAEHIRRTDLLEELHRDNEKRIAKLEFPFKVFGSLKSWFIAIGAIAGAVIAIAKLFKHF